MVDFDPLVPFGWTENIAEQYLPLLDGECVPARIIRMDRGECDVVTPTGPARATCPRADSSVSGLCTGDWVSLDARSHIRARLPRRTAITRSTASGRSESQVLAANVDTVLICAPADGDVDLGRVERMLALVWESGAQPVVVLTKADTTEHLPLDEVRAVAPGAPVLAVSATAELGLDVLVAVLSGTVVLLGPSGAGKSTLANALLGAEVFATDTVRAADKKGRHTTVHRELRPLPTGGTLIDTPGLRGVGLWDAAEGISRTFSDIEELATDCRFADCAHDAEPGCAVRAAVESGGIPERRVRSYRKLGKENAWMEARSDKRLQAEREKVWRGIAKEQRRMYRERGSRR
ncbi:ribosome small subunit-dependent GTPase A [Nocardia grenadensis]|uniref:ribosome small subunit-dependent GTPase A n=1 Tax=Nocardia grenadensis TaxID=931537 RepID=UPI003D93F398